MVFFEEGKKEVGMEDPMAALRRVNSDAPFLGD